MNSYPGRVQLLKRRLHPAFYTLSERLLNFPKSLHKFDNGIYNLCVYWVLSLDTGALRLWSGRYSASKLSKSKKKEEI